MNKAKRFNELEFPTEVESEVSEELESFKQTPGQNLAKRIKQEKDLRNDEFCEEFLYQDLNKPETTPNSNVPQNSDGNNQKQGDGTEGDDLGYYSPSENSDEDLDSTESDDSEYYSVEENSDENIENTEGENPKPCSFGEMNEENMLPSDDPIITQ